MTAGDRQRPIAPHSAGSGAILSAVTAADVAVPAGSRIVQVTCDGGGAYVLPTVAGATTVTATNAVFISPDSGGAIFDVAGMTKINAKAKTGTPNLSIVRLA